MAEVQITDKTRIGRRPERGSYDRDVINAILDEALVCHVGVTVDGQPRVIPTTMLRVGDYVYLHGSPNNQLIRTLEAGAPACVTVTLVDSIVAGRAGFGMSMDYRSVVIFGQAEKITDYDEKVRLVAALIEDILPGHIVRPPKKQEVGATVFVRIPLNEASAKIRNQGVSDPDEDLELDGWAGVIPLTIQPGEPCPCPKLKQGIATPAYVSGYRGPASK